MPTPQRKIKPDLKRELIEKAGGKCANPGCSNWRVHIHHIKHWRVYKSHCSQHMIAVCPSCHDQIHYGRLPITDQTIYCWKQIARPAKPTSAQIYVEPGQGLRIIAGSIAFATSHFDLNIFRLSRDNYLTACVIDEDILNINLQIPSLCGKNMLRVINNHVRVIDDIAEFDYRAGRARVIVSKPESYVPIWLVEQMKQASPQFTDEDRITALDLEVVRPGVVRVQGCWPNNDSAIVIDRDQLIFCNRTRGATPLCGHGEECLIIWDGPKDDPMFAVDQPRAVGGARK
jgi:hypothetical protein